MRHMLARASISVLIETHGMSRDASCDERVMAVIRDHQNLYHQGYEVENEDILAPLLTLYVNEPTFLQANSYQLSKPVRACEEENALLKGISSNACDVDHVGVI